MKVKELIRELQQLPPDAEVVQSCDPEGNGYWRTGDVTFDCRFDFAGAGTAGVDLIDEGKQKSRGALAVVLWAGY